MRRKIFILPELLLRYTEQLPFRLTAILKECFRDSVRREFEWAVLATGLAGTEKKVETSWWSLAAGRQLGSRGIQKGWLY